MTSNTAHRPRSFLKRSLVSLSLGSALLLSHLACEPFEPAQTCDDFCVEEADVDLLKSDAQRDLSPQVPAGEFASQVAGNTQFGFELYRELVSGDDNLFFSPHSISLALAMAYGGAVGNTADEMAATLHFGDDDGQLHASFNFLDLELNSRGADAEGMDGSPFRLNVVNALWGQRNFCFEDSYLDILATNYGAGMRVLDFMSAPEPSREAINNWVEEQTENRIEDLLPPNSITGDTRLVLTNAIYFNASWLTPFEEEATRDDEFTTLAGSTVTVPMMQMTESFRASVSETLSAIEIPYSGEELSMLVLMPAAGSFADFEAGLSAASLDSILASLETQSIALSMPRWELDGDTLSLLQQLKTLGMQQAFSNTADFSGIFCEGAPLISDVLHQAFVKVNEAGTEAAAATAVVFTDSAAPPAPLAISLDQPYLYLIRDHATGAVLFMGRVTDPS